MYSIRIRTTFDELLDTTKLQLGFTSQTGILAMPEVFAMPCRDVSSWHKPKRVVSDGANSVTMIHLKGRESGPRLRDASKQGKV